MSSLCLLRKDKQRRFTALASNKKGLSLESPFLFEAFIALYPRASYYINLRYRVEKSYSV